MVMKMQINRTELGKVNGVQVKIAGFMLRIVFGR
jgi:hypothetical protein